MELSRSEAVNRFGESNVHDLSGGEFVIAGEYFEPLRQERCVLIEQASKDLLAAEEAASRLTTWARDRFPDARYLILRHDEISFHLPGFDDYSYYMLLEEEPLTSEQIDDITIRPADPVADREKVAFWLVQAFED